MKSKMETNYENYCRICLDVESKHICIFRDSTIQMHIKSCLTVNIDENDNLPKSICESCVCQLSNFYHFQLNAQCSQDWLETSIQEKPKYSEQKTYIHPLPDSEYNSDSLLEFLNNTANIEDYLNNLGKEDIPTIVNILDRTEGDKVKISPSQKKKAIKMDIDVLDSDKEIVKELLMKESKPKNTDLHSCFACKETSDSIQTLSRHLSVCESASRTCVLCKQLFNSKQKMLQHFLTHNITEPLTCTCGKRFENKEKLNYHTKNCNVDHIASMGFMYRCKQCKETFTERFQLFKHAKKHILRGEQQMCDICGHIFTGNEALEKHRKQEHNKLNNCKYRCKQCSFSSVNRKEMYHHVQKHTIGKNLKHLCELCGKCFSSKLTLQRHSLQHNSTNLSKIKEKCESMVICEKCGETIINIDINKHKCM
ncbi:PR domain zinc finger protein 15-like [Pieris napi]|uniref:PR domain zinc finger protein 15-like n=1 Tax=Pieris napi TaxID=78633 RepID=UPI001FBA93EA|nr:PR domain zinc finger protein 15-like [Pieris napi]